MKIRAGVRHFRAAPYRRRQFSAVRVEVLAKITENAAGGITQLGVRHP
jgi:hypothetical protein